MQDSHLEIIPNLEVTVDSKLQRNAPGLFSRTPPVILENLFLLGMTAGVKVNH